MTFGNKVLQPSSLCVPLGKSSFIHEISHPRKGFEMTGFCNIAIK